MKKPAQQTLEFECLVEAQQNINKLIMHLNDYQQRALNLELANAEFDSRVSLDKQTLQLKATNQEYKTVTDVCFYLVDKISCFQRELGVISIYVQKDSLESGYILDRLKSLCREIQSELNEIN